MTTNPDLVKATFTKIIADGSITLTDALYLMELLLKLDWTVVEHFFTTDGDPQKGSNSQELVIPRLTRWKAFLFKWLK
ncbi:hypothetical protein QIJ52_gp1 [ssRNA phage SRR6960799_21]|uniref:Uncharacterized protein n=1 Tax=ssRNA phage SRR6960799_21 TaxID=2786578 RepID=A0A8S5KZQ3_9VIRU|nr:hypothetical protein QIJ52_gp1 [ssRNA phage SRR6960799_21]DAD50683.1 TPA_asm: hypothetical protein [ssRNA phage SRR6960799_21]